MASTTQNLKLTKPDANDKVTDTIAALASNFAILDALYPVGTIYQSTRSTNPTSFLGGTWTPITGRMLVGASTDFPAGTVGGEKEHQLSVAEMPKHSHNPPVTTFYGGNAGYHRVLFATNSECNFLEDSNNAVSYTGADQPHNNMPPYRAVYMWERVA